MMVEPAPDDFARAYDAGKPQVVWTRLVADLETPVSAMLKLSAGRSNCFLLESVEGGAVRGRYSIIGIEPDLIFRAFGAKAEEIRARLAGGEAIDKVAGELSLELKSASKLTRTTQPPADLSPAVVAEAFGGPTGYAAVANGVAAGTKVVLVVKEATVPAFDPGAAELAQTRKQIADQIANDYLQQFLVEMQAQAGLSVNQTAMQMVIGQQRPGL